MWKRKISEGNNPFISSGYEKVDRRTGAESLRTQRVSLH
jgi:hypothetical protein